MLLSAAAFATGSISISSVTLPTSVSQGDSFSIVIAVSGSSVTDVSGSLTLPAGISCTPTSSQTISVDGNGAGSATWSCSASVAGDYTNKITASVSAKDSGTGGDLSDSKQTGLSVLSPASLTTSSVISSSSISSGSTATFTVGVNNVGDSSATYNITLSGCSSGISCSPSSVSTTSISGNALVNNQFTVTGSTANTYTITATISSSAQSDITTSQTITVTSSGSNNNNNINSGGGGGDSTPTTVSETKVIANISKNANASVSINKSLELGVNAISITAANNVSGVTITVSKVSKPSGASDVIPGSNKSVYKYIEIKKSIKDEDISSAAIFVQVERAWVVSNNIDENKISLYRYDPQSKAWTKLSTVMVNSDASFFYYSAATPGFSTFAIAGELKAAVPAQSPEQNPAEPVNPAKQPSQLAPQSSNNASDSSISLQNGGYNSLLVLLITVAVLVVGYVYFKKKQDE